MANIIIKGKSKYGKTFSEIESNLRKDGQSSMSDDQLARCKYLEKVAKNKYGYKDGLLDAQAIYGRTSKLPIKGEK